MSDYILIGFPRDEKAEKPYSWCGNFHAAIASWQYWIREKEFELKSMQLFKVKFYELANPELDLIAEHTF